MRTLHWNRVLLTVCALLVVAFFWAWRRGAPTVATVAMAERAGLEIEHVASLSRPAAEEVTSARALAAGEWEIAAGHWRALFDGYSVPFMVGPATERLDVDLGPDQLPEGFVPVAPGPYLVWPDGRQEETRTFCAAARHEVTRDEFAAFLAAVEKDGLERWASDEERAAFPGGLKGYGTRQDLQLDRQRDGENLPVARVSWYAANAYCRWLTATRGGGAWRFRLPTAREWDKLARGTDARRHPWGNDAAPIPVLNLGLGVVDVGAHPELASPYGLLHM